MTVNGLWWLAKRNETDRKTEKKKTALRSLIRSINCVIDFQHCLGYFGVLKPLTYRGRKSTKND